MKLAGLSNYDVFLRKDMVRVRNIKTGRFCGSHTTYANSKQKWTLVTDSGRKKDISVGQLRFMMEHPEISADAISCRGAGVKFNDDGSVSNLYGGERGRSYAAFTGIDDALNTVLFLMAVSEGDKVPLLRFVERSRKNAITTVAKLLKCSCGQVAEHYETAVTRFMREVEGFNVQRIMPIFAWLCKCLKYAVVEQRSIKIKATDNMERIGGIRALSKWNDTKTNE